jgi:HK97 family phage portal protein
MQGLIARLFAPRLTPEPEQRHSGQLLAWSAPGQPAWTPRDYGALAREGYQRNAIAYRCVRLVAEAAASIPLRSRTPGSEAHPLAALLVRPNPEQSGTELLEALYGHLQIAGNGWLEMVCLEGEPRELAVLRPDQVQVIPGPDGWPQGWEHRVGGRTRRLWRDGATGRAPVLQLKLFNPVDDLYGQSPLEAAATAVDIHNAGGAWNKALIDNAARPSGALVYRGTTPDERMTEAQFDRLKAELTAAHAGASNAGRPLVLEGGLDWTPMSLSPTEMDFIEARRSAARDIALAFGVPPMLLGIPGDNTYANYREANLAFWRQTVLPLARKAAAALSAWLQPWSEVPLLLEADPEGVPALSEERETLWTRLEAASFLTTAEKRALAGLAPLGADAPSPGETAS